jgi:hypothetical protein
MANKSPTAAELAAELEQVRAELAATKARAGKSITFKVSQKGAVSVYGLNARFPVTLYRDQWERLLDRADDLKGYILDHAGELATK